MYKSQDISARVFPPHRQDLFLLIVSRHLVLFQYLECRLVELEWSNGAIGVYAPNTLQRHKRLRNPVCSVSHVSLLDFKY